MSTFEFDVSICICTCRRPEALARLLDSLTRLQVPHGCSIEVVVVDNDEAGSGRPTFTAFASRFHWPFKYVTEPNAGVSHARNRCVSEARGAWIAFVDDDEWVEPQWLSRMLQTAAADRADVVIGPVLPHFEAEPPEWVGPSRAFDHHRDRTGRLIDWRCCACGNALIRQKLLQELRGFDTAFGASGAEDTEFFSRCQQAGARMLWCDEAMAYEGVPAGRLSRRWVMSRARNGGRNYARVILRMRGLRAAPGLMFRGLVSAFAFGCIALALQILGRPSAIYFARRATAGLGKFTPWAARRVGLYGDAQSPLADRPRQ